MSKIRVDYELSGVDKARVEVAEFEKGLTSAQKAVLALAKANEATGAALAELEKGLGDGSVSAEEYVAALKAIAAQAPKTAAEVAKAAREEEAAQKKAEAAAAKAAAEAEKAAKAAARQASRTQSPAAAEDPPAGGS